MDIEEDLKKISERFNNGTETMNDIINYCRNYKITFENGTEINVIEKKYFDKLVEKIKELQVLEDDLKDKRIVYVDTPEFEEKFIAKQKVKEILIEIQEEYNKLDKEIDKQIKDKNKDYYKCKENIAIMQTLAYCRDKFEGLLKEK